MKIKLSEFAFGGEKEISFEHMKKCDKCSEL
jgi:DnaJ-class molecular chaperone